LQAFSNSIFRVVQQLTRFQLTSRVARSFCDSWSVLNRTYVLNCGL